MPIQDFAARDFRCLAGIEFTADPRYNLVYGANASGKTSVLEALAYLGRGKSFRGAPTGKLIRHGEKEFILFGRAADGGREASIGVRNSADGLEIRVDGAAGGAASLARALPLQIIDPDVHELVAGSPDGRRRYLDWVAFHVEPRFLDSWRRFRRTLRQRNAALRGNASTAVIDGWNAEFVELAAGIDAGRRQAAEAVGAGLGKIGADLVGSEVRIEYRAGWNEDRPLGATLEAGLDRDRQLGSTQAGPHRADLALIYDQRQARKLVSRGQQKLLACALVLAATGTAQAALERPLLLLLDDPAAELDGDALERLMRHVVGLGCQVVATSLEAATPLFPDSPALFHVERGQLSRVG